MIANIPHPEAAALVSLVDGEPTDADVEAHVAACRECAARLGALDRRSRRFRELLREGDAYISEPEYDDAFLEALGVAESGGAVAPSGSAVRPARTGAGRVRTLRWAAGLVLLAGALSFSPVRAWIVEGSTAAWAWITGRSGTATAPPEVPAAGVPTEVVGLAVGDVLTVRMAGDAVPDSVVVRTTDETRARALLAGAPAEGEILVRGDGFEIRVPGGGGVAEVWAPVGVDEVRLVVDGRVLARRSPGPDPEWRWSVAVAGR